MSGTVDGKSIDVKDAVGELSHSSVANDFWVSITDHANMCPLVQQGAELAYLLLHDPEYRRVRKSDLIEVGRRIRLKQNIRLLTGMLDELAGLRFDFVVISAAAA